MACYIEAALGLLMIPFISKLCLSSRIDYYGNACDGMTFKFICPEGHTVSLKSAFYGRDDSEMCLDNGEVKDDLDLSCSADGMTEMIRQKCDGKQRCDVDVGVKVFPDPCPGTPKYLKVEFDCVEPDYYGVQCEGNKLTLSCPDHKFINPDMNVMYGRLNNVTCFNDDAMTTTNCTSDTAEDTIRNLCKTKQTCDIHVSSGLLGDPCPDNYKYIQVNYSCSVCINEHPNDTECDIWKTWGECQANQKWMMSFCRKACTGCDLTATCNNTHDSDEECEYWASIGECEINPDFMLFYCKRSCNRCGQPDYVNTKTTSAIPPSTTTVPYAPADQITRELVCEGDQRMFRCPPRTYLRIYNATFGRTSNTPCLDPDQGEVNETNCQSEPDVVTKVHTTCTGRMTCIASAYNDALGDPCPGVHKYLDVYFSCEECQNAYNDTSCDDMAANGDCDSNKDWMYENCFKSCSGCHYSSCSNELGEDDACDYWAMRNECVINPVWMTEHCRESCRQCEATVPTCEPDCGVHGVCIATNTCSCDIGYSGSNCTLYDCVGVDNCTGHGACIAPDRCQCDEGWTGADCADYSCSGVSDCHHHGHCVGRDICLCYPYWSGETCSECLLENNSGASCLPCPSCVHGTCRHGEAISTYRGCYSDNKDNPDFDFIAWKDSVTTTSACMRWCLTYNYTYAATTEGNSCKCGNRYGTYGISESCDIECFGMESNETCGGIGAYSVWQTYEGYCQCIGPNWTGPLCDRCAPGYVGSDCHPANRTTTTTTTTTTTSTPTATPVFISSTRMSTTGTSKSATTGSPNMITDREPGSVNTTKQMSNYHSTPSASVHSTTYSVQNVSDYGVLMTLVLKMPWLDIYTDITNDETEKIMNWIKDKLTEYYRNVDSIKVDSVIIKRLRPGSVRVDHVIMTSYASTFAEKRAVQCAVIESLLKDNGAVDTNLVAQPDKELVKNCVTEGVYCLNGATPGFDENGYWICHCPYKYTGERCQNTAKDKAVIIVIITVSVLVPLALLLSLCFAIPRYQRKIKGSSRRRSTDVNSVNTNATAISFEFHNMPTSHSHRRKEDDRKLVQDMSTLGELNEAYLE